MVRTTCHDNLKSHIVNHDAGRDPIKCVAGIKPVSSRVIEHLKTGRVFHHFHRFIVHLTQRNIPKTLQLSPENDIFNPPLNIDKTLSFSFLLRKHHTL